MIEAQSPQHPVSEISEKDPETLRLACPRCGGGLNLKRRHLGITGQCVHCKTPLTAVEGACGVEVIAKVPSPTNHDAAPIAAVDPAMAANPATEPKPESLFPSPAPQPFPREADRAELQNSGGAELPSMNFVDSVEPEYAASSLQTEEGSPFSDRLEASPPRQEARLFDKQEAEAAPFAWMFKTEDDSSAINPAWGTKVPREIHASISPFETESTVGGGFAETLFRERVVKGPAEPELTFSPSFITKGGPKVEAPVRRDCEEKVILDGDGRPLAPMTKEEEEEFAKSFFDMERARAKPRWIKKIVKMATTAAVLAVLATAGYFLTPQEKLVQWKAAAYEWVEPGLAVLDYLPDGLNPRSNVDEDGNPIRKNAFDELKKLSGEVEEFRGTAESELENMKNF